jgi:hypothetical protein
VRGDRRDVGSDKDPYVFELTQFVHHRIDFPGIRSLGIQNGLGVIEDNEDLLGGEGGSQGCQVLGVFNPCTDYLGESGEEMSA